MDLALALNKLNVPLEDRGPCAQSDSTYEAFAAKWRGSPRRPPPKEALEAAWQQLLIEQPDLALPHAEQAAKKTGRLEERLKALEARVAALEIPRIR